MRILVGFERVSLLVGSDQENLCFRLGSEPISQAQEHTTPNLLNELGIFARMAWAVLCKGEVYRPPLLPLAA